MNKSLIVIMACIVFCLVSIGWGVHGIVNRKRINNLAHLILSFNQVCLSVLILVAIIILYYMGKFKF
jgi:Na+/H+ antiporter NhaC